MERQIKQRADALLNAKKKRKLWKNAAVTLAAAVVFCTVYALILPAITLSSEPVCELAEHTHGDDCYTEKTVRTQSCAPDHPHTEDCFDEEGNQLCLYADFWVHTHSDLCYDDTGELICTLEEREAHDHTDACYTTQLTCGQEESEGHTHTEDCYQLVCGETEEGHSHSENCYEKICGQEESGGHSHTDACYETSLTCGKEEIILHTHSDECYAHPEGQEPYLTCGQIEVQSHEHTDSCFETVSISELTCTTTEHTHSPECYASEEQETTEQTTAPTVSETEQEPLCGKEEHIHTDECYGPDPDGGEALLTCAVEAHTHTEECYLQPGREYRYEDETLLVTVVLPADSQVPETAKLLVTPITQEEDRYSQLEQQAQDAIAGTLTQIVLYDLSFYTGEAYLPVEDSAVVTITFLQGQLSEPAEQVTVLHYAQEEAAPVALREVEVQRDENEELSGLTFQTEGFSTYAVVLSNDPVAYAADEAALTLYPGQVRKVGACSLNIEIEGEDVVSAVSTAIRPAKLGLGTSSAFVEDMVDISNALYTFTKVENENNTYKIASNEIYLSPAESNDAKCPGNSTETNTVIEPSTIGGEFYLHNNSSTYLYFYRDGNAFFDRYENLNGAKSETLAACTFLLYTPVTDGTESSNEIPGYKQVTSLDAITDNGQYLIVAEAGSAYYVLYPSTSTTDKYSHVAKVAPYELTITAKEAGTATVTAGTTTLNVTVTDEITVYAGKTVQIELPAGARVTGNENAGVAAVEIDENGMATVTGVADGTTKVTITIGDDTYTWNITTKGTLVPGVTPAGTVINLFDYWVTGENEGQVGYSNQGINTDHVLKFSSNGESDAITGHVNKWTGADGGVLQGIVNSALMKGYPVTAVNDSLGIGREESLAYLFDPSTECAYRKAYSNVSNLLQVDASGYYYYDSTKNYAEFNPDSDSFLLYDDWAVTFQPNGGTANNGQFFPFDDYSSVTKETNASTKLNHFFGMTLTTRFVQKQKGLTDAGENMTFTFSGDDDVWIFVDNVLIADLGGIHDKAGVKIDFAIGTVSIDRVYNETNQSVEKSFADFFNSADLENGIFKDNTYHTLRFFYLERGGNASNLSLKYNLSSYPATAITKVNQYGEPLAGVEFTVRSENGNAYSYTTDSNGQIVFVDDEGMPLSPDEIKSKFGDCFTLEETGVPAGYRKVGEPAKLHFEKGVLVCDNTYTTGVWADPNLLVTAPRTLN
ncbi:MAG: hypothetical protein Q4D50_11710, partial [Eubacteriales bacterium]|nr:hypothetical protein [Eubacteriales bacterium]